MELQTSLVQKYDVVVTNPPYMGGKGQSSKLTEFLKRIILKQNPILFQHLLNDVGKWRNQQVM